MNGGSGHSAIARDMESPIPEWGDFLFVEFGQLWCVYYPYFKKLLRKKKWKIYILRNLRQIIIVVVNQVYQFIYSLSH